MGQLNADAYKAIEFDPESYVREALKAGTLVGAGHTTRDLWMLFLLGVACPAAILTWGWL